MSEVRDFSLFFNLVANNWALKELAVELLSGWQCECIGSISCSCLPARGFGRSPKDWHLRGGGGEGELLLAEGSDECDPELPNAGCSLIRRLLALGLL